ncbi:hypothetical protein JTB14_016197 [Gonioctena quinquepunctata]|nr:hypothetical protein JTB14_016197 [Gonioctena quinquepunctata]
MKTLRTDDRAVSEDATGEGNRLCDFPVETGDGPGEGESLAANDLTEQDDLNNSTDFPFMSDVNRDQVDDGNDDSQQIDPTVHRRGERVRRAPTIFKDYVSHAMILSEPGDLMIMEKIQNRPDRDLWKQAMDFEYKFQLEIVTWKLMN